MPINNRFATVSIMGLALALLSLSSCSDRKNYSLVKERCQEYYKNVRLHDLNAVLSLFGAGTANQTAQKQLYEILKENEETFGGIVSAHLQSTQRYTRQADHKTDDIIKVTYKVEYDSSYFAKEEFYFHVAPGFSGTIDSISSEEWGNKG